MTTKSTSRMTIGTLPNPYDHGAVGDGIADDTVAVKAAITAGNGAVHYPAGTFLLTEVVEQPELVTADNAVLKYSGKHNDSSTGLVNSVVTGLLTIEGDAYDTITISNVGTSTTGSFQTEYYNGDIRTANYQEMTFTISADVTVGDMLLIHNSTLEEYNGAFEVISVVTNLAVVLMLAQGTLRTGTMTATAEVLTTVIQFQNTLMVEVNAGTVNLRNIGLLGPCFPYVNGTRGNVYDPAGGTGVTGVVSRRNSHVALDFCGISGTAGTQVTSNDTSTLTLTNSAASNGGRNGISAASTSKTVCSDCPSTCNLLDGIISQDASFVFAIRASTSQNGRHGVIAAGNGTINVSNALITENGYLDVTGDGVNALTGTVIGVGAIALRNARRGFGATGGGTIRATGANVQENDIGAYSETGSTITISGTVNNNTTRDLLADTGGYILASGTTYSNAYPAVNNYNTDRSFIQTNTTPSDFRISANGNNSAMVIDPTTNAMSLGMNPVSGIGTRANIGGNLLANGSVYVKALDTETFWRIAISGGAIVLTDTGLTP